MVCLYGVAADRENKAGDQSAQREENLNQLPTCSVSHSRRRVALSCSLPNLLRAYYHGVPAYRLHTATGDHGLLPYKYAGLAQDGDYWLRTRTRAITHGTP